MNEHDENNIYYVLSLNPGDVANWIAGMSQGEITYALSIVECAQWKLLDEYVQFEQDCKQARKELDRIFSVS